MGWRAISVPHPCSCAWVTTPLPYPQVLIYLTAVSSPFAVHAHARLCIAAAEPQSTSCNYQSLEMHEVMATIRNVMHMYLCTGCHKFLFSSAVIGQGIWYTLYVHIYVCMFV